MTPEEGQKKIEDWFDNLPAEIEQLYSYLSKNVLKFNTFDLLSYFSYYNHLHDSEQYSDYREDKNFFVSEVLALLCLKSEFVYESSISENDFIELIMQMQEKVVNYCFKIDSMGVKIENKPIGEDDVTSDIANLLSREAKQIRNPGLPEHHLIFTEKLFEPIKDDVETLCGFSISDSVKIRRSLADMINIKCKSAIDEALNQGRKLSKEIIRYKKTKTIDSESVFTQDILIEYSKNTNKEIKQGLQSQILNKVFYKFGSIYTFTAKELSEFSDVELSKVKVFLNFLSCGFPSLGPDDKIYSPITLLKSKPIIEHNNKFMLPSFPLLTWAVEDSIELKIKQKQKILNKYKTIRHDFVLEQGIEYFKKLLPTAEVFDPNLFYLVDGKNCETDGLIIYDQVLFILEAKGNRITTRAKKGFVDRTEKHLEEIIRSSYKQGIRTLEYIENNEVALFETKNRKQININRKDFNEIVIVSLTLEPVGNMSMMIKATNEIGYFNDKHFPWILSIYDLVVLADLIDNPFMLLHYIKRRKKFLSHEALSVYGELDLVSYFLSNGLYIDNTLKDAEEKNVNRIEFMPDTDDINDYYMYKFGYKTKFTKRPDIYISKEFSNFLIQLDRSKIVDRVRIALLILEFSDASIKQLLGSIKKTKKRFSIDKEVHDCSIYTSLQGGIGVTFMTGTDKRELELKLNQYCSFKLNQQSANTWIGLGDISTKRKAHCFNASFIRTTKDTL